MTQTSVHQLKTSVDPREEFKQLYNDHRKHVFAMALSILRDIELAEDVLQEVYIKLYQYSKSNQVTNVRAWLIRVTRNTALDLYRKKKRELTGFDAQYFERLEYISEDPVDKIVLSKYLALLDSGERQIIIMKDISGLKHKEIAKIMEMPLGTVLWKYRMALKKLKKGLE
ncbi:RNA polymerase sigma factor [Bacillaceae bacterium C204]|uniref:RNA polymerase sigma factor n=1 Tax=Neobacillus sp. 204 TaxID=3383351 RepID=UPI00397A0876